jgi:hypothetical protein
MKSIPVIETADLFKEPGKGKGSKNNRSGFTFFHKGKIRNDLAPLLGKDQVAMIMHWVTCFFVVRKITLTLEDLIVKFNK